MTSHEPTTLSPEELAAEFGVDSPEEISDDLYADYLAHLNQDPFAEGGFFFHEDGA